MAQNAPAPQRVGFVDADRLIQAHPEFSKIQELRQQADAEIQPLLEQLQALDQKIQSGEATAKDRQDFDVLRQALNEANQKWQQRINEALKPITDDIDAAIAKVAPEQGFSVVMNRRVAAESNLVVFATPDTDLTELVIQELQR